jgi:Spy/CpxP family protein refolding chaperone
MFGLTRNSRRVALALAFGAGLAGLAPLPAVAQPGAGGDHFIQAIAAFKAQLNLTGPQLTEWDAAVASGKAARDAARQNMQAIKQVASVEMAKPIPDLSAIAAIADQVRDTNTAAHRQVRAQWLRLYATFTPEQAAVVKAAIARRMARMENFREHMRQRFGNP